MNTWEARIERWLEQLKRQVARVEAWTPERLGDRYECFLERQGPWTGRRGSVAFLRKSADEIEHTSPRRAARNRRTADKIEQEGLDITFRMDSPEREDTP